MGPLPSRGSQEQRVHEESIETYLIQADQPIWPSPGTFTEIVYELIIGMRDPNWSRIVHLLYEKESCYRVPITEEKNIHEKELYDTDLFQELNLSVVSLSSSIRFLRSNGLITMSHSSFMFGREDVDYSENTISLTAEGFEVAHERELQQSQRKLNMAIYFFTGILATGSFIQATAAIQEQGFVNSLPLLGLMIVLLILLIAFAMAAGGDDPVGAIKDKFRNVAGSEQGSD